MPLCKMGVIHCKVCQNVVLFIYCDNTLEEHFLFVCLQMSNIYFLQFMSIVGQYDNTRDIVYHLLLCEFLYCISGHLSSVDCGCCCFLVLGMVR